jgi:tRNA1Val (adenine37-N6)-methyltransferase
VTATVTASGAAPGKAGTAIESAAAAGDQRSPAGGIIREARRPPGWRAPGPAPAPPPALEGLWPGPDEDLCWLAGDWRILQRTDGHRFSLDDLTTAWTAACCFAGGAGPGRILDLGCGIGSVLLFLAWRFPDARVLGIEAQALSAGMARRSIAWNGAGAGGRCQVRLGDFREADVTAGIGPFDLITGTPPYFPPGTGLESDHVQRGPCRFEHRGGVEAYCAAAAPLLAPGAPLVLCASPGQLGRLSAAAPQAGLHVERRRDVIPREGRPPLFSVFVLRAGAGAGAAARAVPASAPVLEPPLVARDAAGARTGALSEVRAAMGMPP